MPDDEVIYMGWQEEAFAEIRGRLEAENVRLRAALEQIAGYGCRCDAGWGEFDDAQCPSCVARAALEEK